MASVYSECILLIRIFVSKIIQCGSNISGDEKLVAGDEAKKQESSITDIPDTFNSSPSTESNIGKQVSWPASLHSAGLLCMQIIRWMRCTEEGVGSESGLAY